MKNKVILLAMTCLAMITTAWGQVESNSDRDLEPEQYIFAIQKVWADNPIQVEKIDPNARIRSFAKAFCSRYQDYRPNEAMMDYLKKPGDYSWEEKHYVRLLNRDVLLAPSQWASAGGRPDADRSRR